jgi:hypothetical protein
MLDGETYHSRPDAGYRHIVPLFPLKIHSQALGQDTHPNLPHGIRRLPTEEARVYRRADDDDSSLPAIVLEVGKESLDCAVEALGINALHELEAFERCILHRCPPYGTGVVDEDIDTAVDLYNLSKSPTCRQGDPTLIVSSTIPLTLSKSLVSTGMAVA